MAPMRKQRRSRKFWVFGVLLLAFGGWGLAEFVVLPALECKAAIGPVSALPPPMRRAFTASESFFPAKSPPGPRDWLAQHKEAGQTFAQYVCGHPNLPKGQRMNLYILPLGEFKEGAAPRLALLKEYLAAYYYPLKVGVLHPVPAKEVPAAQRVNQFTGKPQWKTADILRWMPSILPGNCYAMIAVTMTDLYPDEKWNFVFGQASYRDRVGVFSFARYHPSWRGKPAEAGTEVLVLRRAAKVLTHEMGHMFGIHHCIYYQCNMNGANHLLECDATPMHLCPVCLRKLQYATKFDPLLRYAKLKTFYEAHGMDEEARWVNGRIHAISGNSQSGHSQN